MKRSTILSILLSAILSACQNNEKEVLEFQRTNETIIGIIDVKSTNEKIYALLYGHRQNEMEQEGICIFDWNGTPLEKYHTDAYLTRIALTPEGDGSFYGVAYSEEDGYSIVRMEKND